MHAQCSERKWNGWRITKDFIRMCTIWKHACWVLGRSCRKSTHLLLWHAGVEIIKAKIKITVCTKAQLTDNCRSRLFLKTPHPTFKVRWWCKLSTLKCDRNEWHFFRDLMFFLRAPLFLYTELLVIACWWTSFPFTYSMQNSMMGMPPPPQLGIW